MHLYAEEKSYPKGRSLQEDPEGALERSGKD